MKIIIIGCGPMGQAAAIEMLRDKDLEEVNMLDADTSKLEAAKSKLKDERLKTTQMNVEKTGELMKIISKYDCAIIALPHKLVVKVDETCIDAGVNTVDLAYEPEQLELNEKAEDEGVMLIPGCGVAPGLSNILARYGSYRMSKIDTIKIRVGGIPLNPKPPIDYGLFFSLESVIDEYTKPARIIMDGRMIHVPALSGLETIEVPELGTLECFYTDGLSTLPHTMGNVREMWEKTIRWPGHAEKMMTLRELGFFDKTGVKIGEFEVKPIDLTIKMLREKLKEEEDVMVLMVEVIGYMGDVYVEAKYKLIDYYDRELKVTAMGRTTGYTAALIAKMIMKGKVRGKGVIPPENLLTKEGIEELFKELWNRGIRIDEEVVYKKTSW